LSQDLEKELKPATQYGGELNFMEHYGLRYLRHACGREDTHVHTWSDDDVAAIQRHERWALAFAALSGTISGAIIAALEIWLRAWLVGDMENADWDELVLYWGVYLLLAGIVTVIEIAYLYWLVLRSVARVAAIAGMSLSSQAVQELMALGLSRAAMDMPNPRTQFYGVDPYARISGWKLLAYTIAYRAKVGVTSLLLRILVRRILARAALRSIVPFVAIPVYAVWNALIVHWVMSEARGRAAAPIAVEQLGRRIEAERDEMGEEERYLMLAAAAEAMMCARDAHPSFLLLLTELARQFDMSSDALDISSETDWESCLEVLAELDQEHQSLVLDVLCLAAVLGGRPRKRHWKLVERAHQVCGRHIERAELNALRKRFIAGQGIDESGRVRAQHGDPQEGDARQTGARHHVRRVERTSDTDQPQRQSRTRRS
jgi:ABC-type multidrug transport system fused ATPase/permease subunit